MNGPIDQRYLDLQQAATYLGLSPKTLYEWLARGNIPAYKLGRVWRFDIEELNQFVHEKCIPKPLPRRKCYTFSSSSDGAVGSRRREVIHAYTPKT